MHGVQNEVAVRRTGTTCYVPDNPIAKLMYYLNACESICEIGIPRKFRDYQNYDDLSASEMSDCLNLADVLDPTVFIRNGVMVQSDQLCGNSANEFYEITNTRIGVSVSRSFMIAGRQVRTLKIMAFKRSWLENNYYGPFRTINRILAESQHKKSKKKKKDCNVQ